MNVVFLASWVWPEQLGGASLSEGPCAGVNALAVAVMKFLVFF